MNAHKEEEPLDSASSRIAYVRPTYDLRMAVLAWSFPSLINADGLHPWRPDLFQRWLTICAPSVEALHAGRFVLSVWNPNYSWLAGTFSMHEALACWDQLHRSAFISWVARPWWP